MAIRTAWRPLCRACLNLSSMTFYGLADEALSVSIDDLGAELSSVRDAEGRELLWQGGPAWGRRAPVLFPIVGRLPNDELLLGRQVFTMTQHGFARDQRFEAERTSDSSITFTLADNEETRRHFPFAFRLRLRYTLTQGTLELRYSLENPGEETLHASLGAHPGFRWPLPGADSRAEHVIEFEHAEPAPIRRIDGDGLLIAERFPTPVAGDRLELRDSLFADDAIIFDKLGSRSVKYSAPGAPTIRVAFPDFPVLGVWSNPPGGFVCIEPWYGMTSPQDFHGDFRDKPGQLALAPGESRVLAFSIDIQR